MLQANFIHVIAYLLDANYKILLDETGAYVLNQQSEKVISLTTMQYQLIENNFTLTHLPSSNGEIYELDNKAINPNTKLIQSGLEDLPANFL